MRFARLHHLPLRGGGLNAFCDTPDALRNRPDYAELARLDVAHIVHPQTNARAHLEQGPKIIVGAEGSRVFDQDGKDYIDCIAAMWCCPIGFKSERLRA